MIKQIKPYSLATSLSCPSCKKEYALAEINRYASCCDRPLVVNYHLSETIQKSVILTSLQSMWRYEVFLPVLKIENVISLGEGMTPIIHLNKLADRFGFADLLMKDESVNPTGSFKARGLSMAVSKAKELGIRRCIVPTAGNAGGALAAYAAKADIKCTVVMPTHTPQIFKQECELYGAEVIQVDGLINDCAKQVALLNKNNEYFDMSTLKEPYRLEGKKTMGYEIAEQLNWQLPDVIIYPAGGGTGLIGIWKAFKEMKTMGWLTGSLPKMIAVQSKNCAPIIHAVKNSVNWKNSFTPEATIANGLAVPYPFGMDMILQVLNESGGTTVAIREEDIIAGVKEIAKTEGLLICPEGAATWKALQQLHQQNKIKATEKVLLLNTGTGYKYLDNLNF